MRAGTHASAGLLVGLLTVKFGLLALLNIGVGHGFLIFILIGSLLPDLDNPKSKAGRKIPGLARLMEFWLGHRGIYHSVWGCAISAAFFYVAVRFLAVGSWKILTTGLVIGFISHLAMDSLTTKGIHWFRPIHPLHVNGPFTSGGIFDTVFFALLLVCSGFIIRDFGFGVLWFL